MDEFINGNFDASIDERVPTCKWTDLLVYPARIVVAFDSDRSRKRLCVLGRLSAGQQRTLTSMGFYEEKARLFNDNLTFRLSQIAYAFPHVRIVEMKQNEIGFDIDELPALEAELDVLAINKPTLMTVQSASIALSAPTVGADRNTTDGAADAAVSVAGDIDAPSLSINLVPTSSPCSTVRNRVMPVEWNRLKKSVFVRASFKCEICAEKGFDQGFSYPTECHEVFEFDEVAGIQKLARLMSLCPKCNEVKHIEFTRAKGGDNFDAALGRLARLNSWTDAQSMSYYQSAVCLWKMRSQRSWTLDLSLLEAMGVEISSD